MNTQISIDSDVSPAVASELMEWVRGIAERDAARPAVEAARLAYLAAEERANKLDATEEELDAWRAAEAAYRALPGVYQW